MEAAQIERRGISRRELIKRSAVVGGVAWTAPLILDTIASPAAALSNQCSGPGVTLSWIFVLYRVGTNFYVTGFNNSDHPNDCGKGGNNTHGTKCADCTATTGYSMTLNDFKPPGGEPTPGAGELTYSTIGCGGAQTDVWTFQSDAACAAYIQESGGKIFSQGGAEILAAVGFGAGTLRAICPNTSGTGNFVCGIEF